MRVRMCARVRVQVWSAAGGWSYGDEPRRVIVCTRVLTHLCVWRLGVGGWGCVCECV